MVSIEEQFKYIYNLEYIKVKSKEDYYKLNKNIKSLCFMCKFNINKLSNKLIKLNFINTYYINNLPYYINNLPLNLKYLDCIIVNCNLPPQLIYLYCYLFDIYNLPRSLQFIDIINKKNIPKELIYYNYNKNIFRYLKFYMYENIIKLKSIY